MDHRPGPDLQPAEVSSLALTGDNYGTLRTIEEAFGLSLLGAASSSANGDLSSLFG